jgi:protoheme IX farnesyltransferase
LTRQDVVPSRKKVVLPAWLEIAKPRLIPLLLATTLGGMALSEGWPLPLPRLACTLGGGALAAAAAGVLNCLWEQELDGRMVRTSGRALPSGRLSAATAFLVEAVASAPAPREPLGPACLSERIVRAATRWTSSTRSLTASDSSPHR